MPAALVARWTPPKLQADGESWTLATLLLGRGSENLWIEQTSDGSWVVKFPKDRDSPPVHHATWQEAAADAEADLLAHGLAIVTALGGPS